MRITRLVPFAVSVLVLLALASCDHPTSVTNNMPSPPATGSVFVYADTVWSETWINDTTIQNVVGTESENDTVLGSGTFFSKPNVIHFDSSMRNLLRFIKKSFDSSGGGAVSEIIEGSIHGLSYIAYESSGDISFPVVLTLGKLDSADVHRIDSSMQWLTFPVASHATFQLVELESSSPNIGNVVVRDSVVAGPNMTITVGGTAYDCEHAIDYHYNYSDSGFSDPLTKLDLYFSPTLGVPVLETESFLLPGGTFWEQDFTKRLVSFTN